MIVEEIVENVAVQDENAPAIAFQNVVFHHLHAEEMGYHLRGTVVISAYPPDFQIVREFSEKRQDFPVFFGQAPKVDGVEDVAIENQTLRADVTADHSFEQMADLLGLAIVTAQMQIRQYQGVKHKVSLWTRQEFPL
jgi:hypothetical protein